MIRGALASRYGISPLGRGVIRPASGGWWLSGGIAAANCIAAYQAKGAADYAASKVNLANPGTYNAADGAAYPTWDGTNGWIFNGSTQYLLTGITPSSNYSFIIRFSNSGNTGYMFSELKDASTGVGIAPQRGAGGVVRYLYGFLTDKTPTMTGGVLALAANTAYRDGNSEGVIGTSFPDTNYQFAIAARNLSDTYSNFWKGYIQSISIYDITLSTAQVSAVTTAMNAL